MAGKPNWQSASRSSFGPQPKSTTLSSPIFGFGTSGHNPAVYISHRHIKNLYGTQSPGPAMYTHASVWSKDRLGKQTESTKKSPAAFGFGTSSRFSQGAVAEQPGPGKYDSQDSWQRDRMGSITSSLNNSPPKTRIGTEPRFSRGKGDTPGWSQSAPGLTMHRNQCSKWADHP